MSAVSSMSQDLAFRFTLGNRKTLPIINWLSIMHDSVETLKHFTLVKLVKLYPINHRWMPINVFPYPVLTCWAFYQQNNQGGCTIKWNKTRLQFLFHFLFTFYLSKLWLLSLAWVIYFSYYSVLLVMSPYCLACSVKKFSISR